MSVILETPDHPRSCGANLSTISTSSLTVGSSPLVRGQPVIFPPLSVRARIIPARAGPTPFAISVASSVADHPRSCGANLMFSSAFFISSGSSPLVRGQRHCRKHCVCARGSSPLVRGQRRCESCCKCAIRIIPARAGPTNSKLILLPSHSDHPRSCGANSTFLETLVSVSGSSPLVRGQRLASCLPANAIRIIPARAGPTVRWFHQPVRIPDHPRSCGANRVGVRPVGFELRIIPARAGPTCVFIFLAYSNTDHPRSCGANSRRAICRTSDVGSSPLVRGQQSDFTRKKRVESNKNI